jgi:hypothetical protein
VLCESSAELIYGHLSDTLLPMAIGGSFVLSISDFDFEAGLKLVVAGQFICVPNRCMKSNYLSFIQLPKNTLEREHRRKKYAPLYSLTSFHFRARDLTSS